MEKVASIIKKNILYIVIAVQILGISYLMMFIKNNTTISVLVKSTSLSKIQKLSHSKLVNFYEPSSNQFEYINIDWLNYYPKYSFNNDSLHDRYNYNVVKKKGVYRIITLGDSFTFGTYVSTNNNWTEILEDQLNQNNPCKNINKFEVINLGMEGYDIEYAIERYKKRGKKYNPDLVIWFITDPYRVTEEFINITSLMEIDEKIYENNGIYHQKWNLAREEIIKKYGANKLLQFQASKIKEFRNNYFKRGSLMIISPVHDIETVVKGNNIYFEITKINQNKKYLLPDKHFNHLGHINFAFEIEKKMINSLLTSCN